MPGNKKDVAIDEISTGSTLPFFSFIIKDKTCLRYLKISIVITIIYFIAFKFLYPIGSYYWDSRDYVQAASLNLEANLHPLGYSNFMRFFHIISHSDTLLVFAQYISNVIANLFLFFTLLYFFPLKKIYRVILFILLMRNPLYIIYSNYVMSDAFFCSLTVMWFTVLLWIMYRPRWLYFFIQLVLLYWLFIMRYTAIIYPLFVVGASVVSKQAIWKKIVSISITFLVIIGTVNSIIHKTKEATGIATFSAFGGWQLANNSMLMMNHFEPDSSTFTTKTSKEIYGFITHYYDSLKMTNSFNKDKAVNARFMWDWNGDSPLWSYRDYYTPGYFAEHPPVKPIFRYVFHDSITKWNDSIPVLKAERIQPQNNITTWDVMGSVYEEFGTEVIKKYPLEYWHYFIWPNIKLYFKPPVELYNYYNNSYIVTNNADTLTRIYTDYYHYPSKKIDQTYAALLPALMWPWNWLVTVINILLLLLVAAYYLMHRYKNDTWFNHCLIFYMAFYLSNFVLNTFTAPTYIRYHIAVLTLSMVFIIYLWQRVFGVKKSPDTDSQNIAPTQTPASELPEIVVTVPGPPLDKLNRWFKKRITLVLCILILSWIGVRVFYYNSIVKSPLYSLYLFNESDNKFFDDWAKYLNKDWLNEKPFHPYHWWHKAFADYYLQKHPEKLEEILAARTSNDYPFVPGKVLWNEWYHGNQYHQEPLYPYLLAVFYHFNIDAVNAMIILQLMLGVLSGVLLFFITRKYFGETTAVLTGVLYLLCGILMYNEIILLRTSWIVFLTILNVVVIDRVFSKQKSVYFFLCGLCIGFSVLMESTFALFLIGVLIITFSARRQSLGRHLKYSGWLFLGFFIVFSPLIIRNTIVGAPAFSTNSVGPITFTVSNTYGTHSISAWNPSAETDAEIMGQSNGSLNDAIIATLKTYPSFGAYCSLEWKKLKAVWSGIEFPNNENYYFYKQYIPVLQYTDLNFFWIAPLALAGLIVCIYYRKKHYALYMAIVIQLVTLLAFYVLARLRAPLVILSLPLAAFALVEGITIWLKKRSIILAEIGIFGFFMFLILSGCNTKLDINKVTDGDYKILYITHFADKLKEYETKKQWDKWLELQKKLIDMAPDYVNNIYGGDYLNCFNYICIAQDFERMHQQRKKIYTILRDTADVSKENNSINTLNYVAVNSLKGLDISGDLDNFDNEAYYNRGLIYLNAGKTNLAIADFGKVISLDSTYADAYNNRALLYLNTGEINLAMADLNKAIAFDSTSARYLYNRGIIYSGYFNRKDLAIADFTRAIKLDSTNAAIYNNRGLCYVNTGETNLALADFTKAISFDTNNASAYSDRAFIYFGRGKNDSALADCNKAIAHDPTSALYYYNRGLFYKGIKQYEKAAEDFTSGIELKPQNIEVYFYNRGICNASLQNYNGAIADFSESIELNPSVADYWLSRSFVERKLGQNGAAKMDALKASQL